MKYEVKFTGQFKRDLKLAKKQGKDRKTWKNEGKINVWSLPQNC